MSSLDDILKNPLLDSDKEKLLINMSNDEIIKEIEALFSTLKNLNYLDCDILVKAGNNLKDIECQINEYLINFLNLASSSFDEALIYWFLYSYWQDKNDLNQSYTQMLFDKAKSMTENPNYGNRTACLLVFTRFLNLKELNKKDAYKAVEVLEFIKKELEIQSKSEELKKNALYSVLKKTIKEGIK